MTGTRGTPGGSYPVRDRGRLTPDAVRRIRFRRAEGLRRGLKTEDVRQFIDQVSKDMASLYDELAQVYTENHRIKAALRDWQSNHGAPSTSYRDRSSQ
ncbi:DivIVA domain-containing protein [Actinoplanes sp. G11-F43]|uniref:DivIVA domain-containing protein n=1 Tax=Actinoplanes sp. G11-F43 TaxID=3424130 RepID=UPI003D331979